MLAKKQAQSRGDYKSGWCLPRGKGTNLPLPQGSSCQLQHVVHTPNLAFLAQIRIVPWVEYWFNDNRTHIFSLYIVHSLHANTTKQEHFDTCSAIEITVTYEPKKPL